MKKWIGYQKGINLGGWLSQCEHTTDHYENFIKESDIETIASWGLDHIRLPIDYDLIETAEGETIESGYKYIDQCIEHCEKYGLNLILDLHKTAGFSFDEGEAETGFFQSQPLIDRFIALWEGFAQRYGSFGDRIAFELLNEVVDESDNAPWMEIAEKTVKAIRKYAPDTKILIGSYFNNSVTTVKHIAQPFDENIVYNFHCYEPLLFTHQGAYWVKNMSESYRIGYPITKEKFSEETDKNNSPILESRWAVPESGFSPEYFENLFAEALKTAEERNVMLYCGEYGVIDRADTDSALAWYRDIHAVFEKHGIGHAAWTYKSKDFGISDTHLSAITKDPLNYL